eukprot:TRINITY_DN1564_c4_g2_i1.p1 TRINITY_DN1564_c4_g2~~TRINITY_DN1564_c4_g2_i1.p1  ORF type:complete len:232 (-),score=66.82 TRINITY_DN1564_c4_g2_i1:144-839(-)
MSSNNRRGGSRHRRSRSNGYNNNNNNRRFNNSYKKRSGVRQKRRRFSQPDYKSTNRSYRYKNKKGDINSKWTNDIYLQNEQNKKGKNILYLSNLNGTTEDKLREIFSTFGTINSINIDVDQNEAPTGFGELFFKNAASLSNALSSFVHDKEYSSYKFDVSKFNIKDYIGVETTSANSSNIPQIEFNRNQFYKHLNIDEKKPSSSKNEKSSNNNNDDDESEDNNENNKNEEK